jgi:hypothetical protein
MKILFLDIDGVLNSDSWFHKPWTYVDGDHPIDPTLVERVNEIIRGSDCKVVISSAWREHFDLPDLISILKSKGLEAEVIGKTPRLPYGIDRGIEIQAWIDLQDEPPTHIVILDDYEQMAHLEPFLVRTNPEVGVSNKDVLAALDMLILGNGLLSQAA